MIDRSSIVGGNSLIGSVCIEIVGRSVRSGGSRDWESRVARVTIFETEGIKEEICLPRFSYIFLPMIDQLTLLLATPIAKAILDKFYEGVGSKLGEKAVELLPEKVKQLVQQLGQLAWIKCLRGKPGTDELLQKAANGSTEDQKKLTEYLHKALDTDAALKQEAQKIAEEIHLEINNDFGQMTQINRDQSTGYQTKTGANNTNYFGGTHHHH